jgi:alpha-1,3-rhamnosyl/mannosyltransferase
VGTVEPRKNVPRLIEAHASLAAPLRARFPLALAGAPGPRAAEARERARALLPPGEVRFLGYVPDGTATALLAGAACLAYPSLYEGFGLPPLEAMACGTPVVASSAAAVRETVGDAAIVVDPEDVGALAAAIARVLEDPDLAARLAARGLARAARFSWAETARLTTAAYEAAASG